LINDAPDKKAGITMIVDDPGFFDSLQINASDQPVR
jgi:hypothetical protein